MDRRYDWKLLRYDHVECSAWFDRFHWHPDPDLRARLRSESGLAADLADASSPWAEILHLMHWVRGLSEHEAWDEAPDLSALRLLEDARAGRIAFRCVEYAHMLQQVLAAFGFPARVVGLRRQGSDEGLGKAHVVVDVWSPDHRKWVELDPQFDTAYEDSNGRLLSTLEVHDFLRAGSHDRIAMTVEAQLQAAWTDVAAKDTVSYEEIEVPDGFSRDEIWDMLPKQGDFQSFKRHWLENHHHLTFGTSFGLLRPRSANGAVGETLFLYDPGDLPPLAFQRMRQNVVFVRDRAAVDFRVNGVELQWSTAEVGEDAPLEATRSLSLHMKHSMPWFDHYVVSVDGHRSEVHADCLLVALHQGENDLAVTPVNDLGRRGSEARLVIRVP